MVDSFDNLMEAKLWSSARCKHFPGITFNRH
jgi:hypothetical protein